jgi:predicted transcriptional regulator
MNMTPKLSEQQRLALEANPEEAVEVEDEQTHRMYVIIDQDLHRRAMDALERMEDVAAIRAGFAAAAEGRVSTLEEVDARIRQKLGFPPAQ